MTKQELEQIRSLKKEIELIQDELKNLPMITDSVTGSSPEYPYTAHRITIKGIDVSKGQRLRAKLERKLDKLQDMLLEMEEWLDTVADGEMRVILRLKYRNGLNWTQIARELHYADESVPRKRHNRFLEMTDKSEI